jgi:hypothetical protein
LCPSLCAAAAIISCASIVSTCASNNGSVAIGPGTLPCGVAINLVCGGPYPHGIRVQCLTKVCGPSV